MCLSRRVSVVRPNVHEFLIAPFGPSGGGQLLNCAIIEFPEELEKWEGTNGQHSRAGNSALKLQTLIKGAYGLSTLTQWLIPPKN